MSWEGAVDVDVAAGDARTRSLLDVAGVHPAAVVGVLGAGEAIDSRGFFGAGVVGAAGTARLAPITVKDRHTPTPTDDCLCRARRNIERVDSLIDRGKN